MHFLRQSRVRGNKKKWSLIITAVTFTSVEKKANIFKHFREKNAVKCQMSDFKRSPARKIHSHTKTIQKLTEENK